MPTFPILSLLQKKFPLNAEQSEIVAHEAGPLLVIAGPGSGKTRSLLLLALNLLLREKAEPSELVLCTYTDRAASEMQDRLVSYAHDVGYRKDLSGLRIGTIHSICKQLIAENISSTVLQDDFQTIDAREQQLLIFEHLPILCDPRINSAYRSLWHTPWNIACNLAECFNRIAEDLLADVLSQEVANHPPQTRDAHLCSFVSKAYQNYQKLLVTRNCLDFAHLQTYAYKLLNHPIAGPRILASVRYVLVDEYQDTNYIQEQILRKLVSGAAQQNLCVVGDEDQALYRFRGATVRNILEFQQTFPDCKQIRLLANYRSHREIINAYNQWMCSCDWTNPDGAPFRSAKEVVPALKGRPGYHAVYTAVYQDRYEEAEQFVALVQRLKAQRKIQDYSQIALLLRSVKPDFSARYIAALEKAQIPCFCPRTGAYFQQDDVRLIVGCLARILDYAGMTTLENDYVARDDLPVYMHECEIQVRHACQRFPYLLYMLQSIQKEIQATEEKPQRRGFPLTTYFYRLLTVKPFADVIRPLDARQQGPQHNLEQFSQLLALFQRYYPHDGITVRSLDTIRCNFFQKFLCVLFASGLNVGEEQQLKLPIGCVPILTIHQAKGLEFPVVVVGGLDKAEPYEYYNRYSFLQSCALQPPFEPDERITDFDHYRLFYVAFSRAKHLLLLTASQRWQPLLDPLCNSLPPWEQADITQMPEAEAAVTDTQGPLVRYGLTSHIQYYDTCPRQFQFFRAYHFVPGKPKEYLVGQLVHAMLEYIHRVAYAKHLSALSLERLKAVFERKLRAQVQFVRVPLDARQKAMAWQQVLRYYEQNQQELQHVLAAEFPVQMRRSDCVLTGKADLLIASARGPVLIDFKTQPRLPDDAHALRHYRQQLHFYAQSLAATNGQRPEQLFLYWTAEEHKQDSLMEIPYDESSRAELDQDLQEILDNIQHEKFHVRRPPSLDVCRACDLRYLCRQEQLI